MRPSCERRASHRVWWCRCSKRRTRAAEMLVTSVESDGSGFDPLSFLGSTSNELPARDSFFQPSGSDFRPFDPYPTSRYSLGGQSGAVTRMNTGPQHSIFGCLGATGRCHEAGGVRATCVEKRLSSGLASGRPGLRTDPRSALRRRRPLADDLWEGERPVSLRDRPPDLRSGSSSGS